MIAVCPTQYTNFGTCPTACAAYLNRSGGAPGDDFGDNFYCRMRWATVATTVAAAGAPNPLFCPVAGPSGKGNYGGMAALPEVLQCGPDYSSRFTKSFNTVPRICKAGKVLGECCCGVNQTTITRLGHNFIGLFSPLSGGAPCLGSANLDVPGFFIDDMNHARAAVSVPSPPVNFQIDINLQRGGNELKTTTSLQPTCLVYGCVNTAGDCTPSPPESSTGRIFSAASYSAASPVTILVLALAALVGKYLA
jgi:hypothetical protein